MAFDFAVHLLIIATFGLRNEPDPAGVPG